MFSFLKKCGGYILKKRIITVLLTVALLLTLFPIGALAAGNVAQVSIGRTEYEALVASDQKLSQTFGLNTIAESNAGDPVNHRALFSGNGMAFQMNETGEDYNLYADADDVTVLVNGSTFNIAISGDTPVYSVCLGLIATDSSGTYLSDRDISITINGENFSHTTGAAFGDNDVVFASSSPITSISFIATNPNTDYFPGLSYLTLGSDALLPAETPTVSSIAFDGTDYTVRLAEQTFSGATTQYQIDGGVWGASREFSGLLAEQEYTFNAQYVFDTVALPASEALEVTIADIVEPIVSGRGAIRDRLDALSPEEIGNGHGQYPQSAVDALEQAYADSGTYDLAAAEIAGYAQDLEEALEAFEDSLIQVDATELEALLETARETDLTGYTQESGGALLAAIEMAEQALAGEHYTADELSAAYSALRSAIDGLEPVATPTPTATSNIDTPKTGYTDNTVLYVVIAAAALIAAVAIVVLKKRAAKR
jgi:LPXTG-motif cell wall-anchored protein